MFPNLGDMVRLTFLEIDEVEVICWLPDYQLKAYFSNQRLEVKPSDIDFSGMGRVCSLDYNNNSVHIDLIQVLPDLS